MKRAIALILTLTMLLALPVAQAVTYSTATVKGGWLRLRDGASAGAKTISAYYTGAVVTILGQSGDWYHVLTQDGKTGYMHGGYLTINGMGTGSQPGDGASGMVQSANGKPVRLRSGPSVQYAILASYPVGTPLTVLSAGAEWSQVRINGRVGYMMNEFIQGGGGIGTGYTAYVVSANGRGVVMRSGPSKQYEVIATYQVGQPVTVLDYGSTWCRVRVNGLEGYMMSEFLSTVKPEVSEPNYGTAYTAYVTSQNGKGVRMRMGAGKVYPTVATYSVGTQVTVLEYGTTWCRIRVGSNTGYMMTEFLTTKAPNMVTAVTLNATSAQPGDILIATVTPASADVSIVWIDDKGVTLGYGDDYAVQKSDVGRKIRASVSGSGATSGTAVSAWATVKDSYISSIYQLKGITVSDTTPTVGQTLTATLSPAGATASISWFRDNGVFVGSGSTYKVKAADEGYRLYAWADGTGATSGEATSEHTSPVGSSAPATIVLQQVRIDNPSPRVGDTIKAVLNPTGATASFTWRSSAGHILGYGETYTVRADDLGNSIYVYANGTGTTSGSVVSSLTAKVEAKVDNTLRVDGVTLSSTTPFVGQTLYVTLAPQNATASYTWFRDDDKVLSTTSYYTVRAEDVGHTLYVWAEGTNGTFGYATSKITSPVTEK